MNRLFRILFLFVVSSQGLGQTNLVPNGSFENHTICPYSDSQLYLATPWFLGPSTDLFDSCSSYANVPYVHGQFYDTLYAKNGHALIGMHCYGNGREYAAVKLTDTLKANFCYFVEFYFRPGICNFAINNIAANLSPIPYSNWWNTSLPLGVPLHITRYNNPILKDTNSWTQVSGIYNAVGGETYLAIGNFTTDQNTDTSRLHNFSFWCSYNFIDAVSAFSINPSGILPWAYKDTTILLGDSVYIGNYMGGNFNPSWYTYSGNFITNNAGIIVSPSVTTKYVVQFTLCGTPRADTINVKVIDDVGIGERFLDQSDVSVSPNPCNDIVHISILKNDIRTQNLLIKIYDLYGREIERVKMTSKSQDISLFDIPTGIYYMQVCKDQEALVTKKIAKR